MTFFTEMKRLQHGFYVVYAYIFERKKKVITIWNSNPADLIYNKAIDNSLLLHCTAQLPKVGLQLLFINNTFLCMIFLNNILPS